MKRTEPVPQPWYQTGYDVVEHTADWALRLWGSDLEQLLINAARGMTTLLVSDVDAIAADVERVFELDALDAETLLVDWLSELAFWAEDELLIFHKFSLSDVSETHLRAVVRGGHARELIKHIKAVTYHELEIVELDGGLTATIVFDV